MTFKEWETYLCFLVDRHGTVVFSPQGPAFIGKPSYAFGASENDQDGLKQAIEQTVELDQPVSHLEWSARYGDEVREYLVSVDRIPTSDERGLALVRLYRNEKKKVQITQAEQLILQGIIDGIADEDIARQLDISKSTVRRHVMNLKEKFGVNGRPKLAVEAYRLGLIHLS